MSYKHNPQGYPQFLEKVERLSHLIKRQTISDKLGASRENRTPVSSLARTHSTTKPYSHGAPGGTRTPNKRSEVVYDIHFTTGALYQTLSTVS